MSGHIEVDSMDQHLETEHFFSLLSSFWGGSSFEEVHKTYKTGITGEMVSTQLDVSSSAYCSQTRKVQELQRYNPHVYRVLEFRTSCTNAKPNFQQYRR